jgi:hypothetical protein
MGILMQGVLPAFQDTVAALRCLDNLKLENIKRKLIASEQFASMVSSHGGSGDKAQAFLTPGEKKKCSEEDVSTVGNIITYHATARRRRRRLMLESLMEV